LKNYLVFGIAGANRNKIIIAPSPGKQFFEWEFFVIMLLNLKHGRKYLSQK